MSPPLIKVLIRLAGVTSIISGLAGIYIWGADISDRADGDSLRFGFFHNPLVQYPSFNVPAQEGTMEFMFWCSVVAVLGGLLIVIPVGFARHLVTLQAKVSIIVNTVFVLIIVHQIVVWWWHPTRLNDTGLSLLLRLGIIAVDASLWVFLSSASVREFFRWQNRPPEHAFPVILKESNARAG